jgi:hypothetical protein
MTRVLWGDAGNRFFETGVDRGVLYLSDQDGVAWNGLTSVEESPSGGEARPYYQDGIKFLNVSGKEEFEATISAFSAPPEFGVCDGTVSIQNGLFVTQQPRRAFSFSYRTMIGNDLDPLMGYKIHLVYNALAAPSQRTNATMSNSPEASSLSWSITTLPPSFTGYRPTAHLVIDSRSTPHMLLASIEEILYGGDAADARIPFPSELITLFASSAYPAMKAVMVADNVWEIHETDQQNSRTVISPTHPSPPAGNEEPILWLDTSGGNYAIPKLVTGG